VRGTTKARKDGMSADGAGVEIRRCRASDIEALGIVGPAAYAEAYGYLWDDPSAFLRQLTTFSASAFAGLLAREETRIWVATLCGDVVGFLSMNLGVADPITNADGGAEIGRIYILGPARRLRIGSRLLTAAIEEASATGCAYVWLDVMASADWARRAYAQWGFEELDGTTFTGGVAAGLADMLVMAKPTGGSAG
jgi:ribosomal protein S18 acetylase RimI-like enzyme